jgi:hypothetical protein
VILGGVLLLTRTDRQHGLEANLFLAPGEGDEVGEVEV